MTESARDEALRLMKEAGIGQAMYPGRYNWTGTFDGFVKLLALARQSVVRPPDAKPVAYLCPVGCGCTWRDNGDGSMSLFGHKSQSCQICEYMPLAKLMPLYAAPQPPAGKGEGPSLDHPTARSALAGMEVVERNAIPREIHERLVRDAKREALREAADLCASSGTEHGWRAQLASQLRRMASEHEQSK